MRGKGAQLGWRFSSVNQRWQADRDLDWSKWIQLTASCHLFANRNTLHLIDPWFIRRCPGWVENNVGSLAHARRQRKLRVPNSDFVRLYQRTFAENIHAIRWNVYDYAGVLGNGIECGAICRPGRFARFTSPCPVITDEREKRLSPLVADDISDCAAGALSRLLRLP